MPTVSELPAATSPLSGTELVVGDQSGQTVVMTVDQILAIAASGVYSATFKSGYLQFTGPSQALNANPNFIAGLELPNPTGTSGPCLLLGSGGGGGVPTTFCIIQDQAFDNTTPGNTLLITAGETQPAGTAPGGLLWLIGGGSFGGTGGQILLQAGTSLNGPGGIAVLQGGNSTTGTSPTQMPGDVFVIAGETGYGGANAHIICTETNGRSGVVRFRQNSNTMMDLIPVGTGSANTIPFAMFLYGSGQGGFGTTGAPLVSGGASGSVEWFSTGFSGSITFGTGHSMTVVNGLITAYS